MIYEISTDPGRAINFAPGAAEEILQNVRTLLATTKYTVPLDRALGIDAAFLDRAAPDAMARLRVVISEEIARSEPRAKVRVVEFKKREDEAGGGFFYPILQVEINEK
ncbi:MAG: hypothetical protein LBT23_10495 [Synergistaceae bacterium]|jgi:hypothetical protein|nr:hypothetical protein [Synergistaceae bacterium]